MRIHPVRAALLALSLCSGAAAFAADPAAAPCTGGPAVYEGSRSAVLADQALWKRAGMDRLSKLAEYEPNDPQVLKAQAEYRRLRSSDAYGQEVQRIAAARGETLSAFAGTGCPPAR